jgi:hypothetical protein
MFQKDIEESVGECSMEGPWIFLYMYYFSMLVVYTVFALKKAEPWNIKRIY